MDTEYSVRRLKAADLDRIQEIEDTCFGREAYDRNLFAEFFHTCGDLFLAVEGGSGLCGYMITCVRGERAELVSVAVLPRARRSGAASALLETTLRRLRRRKVARIRLMVRIGNPARSFYERYGFRKVRTVKGYYEDGSDGILMARAV